MLVVIRGAGDIATGIGLRLWHSGLKTILLDLPHPTAIRRTVCFSQAILYGNWTVEDATATYAATPAEALALAEAGGIAILRDETAACLAVLRPDAVVDAILAKENLGTHITDAPVVVAVGPGFTAGVDCHAVVETRRGHDLGRVLLSGSAQPNTGIPGTIGGYSEERVLRAPAAGIFRQEQEIGALVQAGQIVGYVGDAPMACRIGGVLRGILPDGTPVYAGMKSGDVDPRGDVSYCYRVSDKALAVGGGVLEACLRLSRGKEGRSNGI